MTLLQQGEKVMGTKPKYVCNCPFYLGEGKKGIWCEGVDGSKKIIMEFKTESQKDKYIRKHCSNCYPESCNIYKLIMENYNEA